MSETIILREGMRKSTPVALVKKRYESGEEYIIAIRHKLENDKISWGYGYYYQNDFKQAEEDFMRVLNGEYLTNIYRERKNNISYKERKNKNMRANNCLF